MSGIFIFLVVPMLLFLMLLLGFYLGSNNVDVFADNSLPDDGAEANDWSHINHLL